MAMTSSSLKDSLSPLIDHAKQKTGDAGAALMDLAGRFASNPTTERTLRQTQEALAATQKLLAELGDNITGATILAEAQKLHEMQRRYNDVLANRLAEALDKIHELEARLAKVESTHER